MNPKGGGGQQQPKSEAAVESGGDFYPIRNSYGEQGVGGGGEHSTVVNIEIFDDQLSMSSISTNSRLSLEGPPAQSSPPLSLTNGGLMDTNLMHFSESAGMGGVGVGGGGGRGGGGRGRGGEGLDDADDDEEEEEDQDEDQDEDQERERERGSRRNL